MHIRITVLSACFSLLCNQVVLAGSPADRARAMINANLVFQPSVFFGEKFPSCDFLKPGQAAALLGNYKFDVTFYDKEYQVVEVPTATGRYGAVVTIIAEDGQTYTRLRTLYRSPKRISLFFDRVQGQIQFPKETGLDTVIWSEQHKLVNDYLAFAVGRDIQRSHDFAVLLAGLEEIGKGAPPASRLASPVTRDRKWWLTLKRELNGNEARFADAIEIPTIIDGLNAPTLRQGTLEEAGMKPDTTERLDAVLAEWKSNSDQPFNVCVARNGVVFYHKAFGTRDGEAITTDTRHVVFSITKALSGTLLMMFVDHGVVSLDDPVEKFLPEFRGKQPNTPATLRHLLTHTADMDGHFTDHWNDLEHIYGEAYRHLAIGKQHRYNGTSIAIGMKVLEQLSGLTLPELYATYLFEPLDCEAIESIDGSAMTWSNAYDLARIGQLLANRGGYGNRRFFSEETMDQMLPRKLDDILGPNTNITWGIGLTWFREGGLSERTIGHGSASSCTLRVDLENDLVITMTRRTAGENFSKYYPKFIETITSGIHR